MQNITEALEDLVMVKEVWDTAMLCELQFADWRDTLWNDIRTDIMEDGAKAFVKEVKGLNKKVGRGLLVVLALPAQLQLRM